MGPMRRFVLPAAAFSSAVLAGAAVAPTAQAAPGAAPSMVPTVWDCTNGDVLTFALPPVVLSPGAGALVAPFPGFLTAVNQVGDGQPTPPLGTWLVLGIVTPDGTISIGEKVGLSPGALTCTLEGTTGTLVIAPAGH